MEKYRVWWINNTTGKSGHGEPIDYDVAVAWCNLMNDKYPDIWHYWQPASGK